VPRRLPCALLVAAALCAPASAGAASGFGGGYVPNQTYDVTYAAATVLPRIVCPAGTRSTERQGDFSFCTGTLVISYQGRVVGTAPFSVRTWDSHAISVPIERSMRYLFPPRRSVRLHWVARSHDGRGVEATNSGNLTARNVYKR
jgi:hypothetical protein